MAYLLRSIRQNTIRKNMYRYLFMVIGAAVFLDLFSVAFHRLNVGQYEMAMAQVQSLNQFYVSLEEANHNLSTYVRSGEDELFQGFCLFSILNILILNPCGNLRVGIKHFPHIHFHTPTTLLYREVNL